MSKVSKSTDVSLEDFRRKRLEERIVDKCSRIGVLLLLLNMIGHLEVLDSCVSAFMNPESSSNTMSTSSKRMTLNPRNEGGGRLLR